jgi:hypothetical protein
VSSKNQTCEVRNQELHSKIVYSTFYFFSSLSVSSRSLNLFDYVITIVEKKNNIKESLKNLLIKISPFFYFLTAFFISLSFQHDKKKTSELKNYFNVKSMNSLLCEMFILKFFFFCFFIFFCVRCCFFF